MERDGERERERKREKEREMDRQTDGWTDRQRERGARVDILASRVGNCHHDIHSRPVY